MYILCIVVACNVCGSGEEISSCSMITVSIHIAKYNTLAAGIYHFTEVKQDLRSQISQLAKFYIQP